MSSSLLSEEMFDFRSDGPFTVGRIDGHGQRSAHIYHQVGILSLCKRSNRSGGRYDAVYATARLCCYYAGERTCQACLLKYRTLNTSTHKENGQ